MPHQRRDPDGFSYMSGWRCPLCNATAYTQVQVARPNGTRYSAPFYERNGCSHVPAPGTLCATRAADPAMGGRWRAAHAAQHARDYPRVRFSPSRHRRRLTHKDAIRHDVDHGSASEVAKKRLCEGETTEKYMGKKIIDESGPDELFSGQFRILR